jgi:hypothetical protein
MACSRSTEGLPGDKRVDTTGGERVGLEPGESSGFDVAADPVGIEAM